MRVMYRHGVAKIRSGKVPLEASEAGACDGGVCVEVGLKKRHRSSFEQSNQRALSITKKKTRQKWWTTHPAHGGALNL